MMKKDFICIDFVFVPREELFLRGFDASFLNERGVFETMRSYDGSVFALDRHLRRLRKGCVLLKIPPPGKAELEAAVLGLIKINHLKDARIRLTVIVRAGRLHVFVLASGISPCARGYNVMVMHKPRRKASVLSRVKLCRRDFCERLYQKAVTQGYQEALYLDPQGFVVEGARTNVFVVINGALWTPILTVGCLPGVTRSIVIEQACQAGLVVRQRKISVRDLARAQEVFLTNAVIGVMPVVKLDAQMVSSGKIGTITMRLKKRYEKLIRR
ncbi:MAG: aminotransferase class IV [Candidatus Omnitrophota bacterium]